jgi:hypothetical protein
MMEYKITSGDVLIIDEDSFNILNNYYIRKSTNTLADGSKKSFYYATEKFGNRKSFGLGSVILGVNLERRAKVIHVNENITDFRKSNLKITSVNTKRIAHKELSEYKGIQINTAGNYSVNISFNGKRCYVGSYESPLVAAIAYNKAMDIAIGQGNYIPNDVKINSECLRTIYEKVYIRNIYREVVSNQGKYIKHRIAATSEFIGVSFENTRKKYSAHISYRKHNIFIIRGTELECGMAYNKVAFYMYGENAILNKISDWEKSDILTDKQWSRILLNLDRAGFEIT